jgi:hypothetical protein
MVSYQTWQSCDQRVSAAMNVNRFFQPLISYESLAIDY